MSKSLKTKIIVTIALVVIGFWIISGVLVRRHAASFMADQQSRIQEQGEQGQLLDELLREKSSLLRELAGIRVASALVALVTLSILLGLMWRRRVSQPTALLSDRIHKMRLGTWNDPIPVFQDDEMGTLVQQFNELGPELAFTAHQYAAASKLAAMALIGQRVVRRTMTARQRLLAVSEALSRRPGDERFQEIAVEQVRQVAGELESVATDFDQEFQAELERVGSSTGTTGGNRAA